jgi:EmrB/QacA subfamily drug resistance transporter
MTKLLGNKWFALAIVLIGFFMILIDTTIVNVSIPTIIADLHTSLSSIEWIISGYALSFAALLITFGRLGDIYGYKRLFISGLVVFTIASIFSGEAQNISTLIIARLFQGVGGAMISPATLSIISSTFKGRERSVAFGGFGAVSGIAVAIGPILGGWLTTYYSWRWIFRVNIPIGIIGVILALLVIPEIRSPFKQKIDFSGMITSSLGFFFLVFGLIEGQTYGWWKPLADFTAGSFTWAKTQPISIIGICFILAALLLISFVVIQYVKTKTNAHPAVNLNFFKHRTFRYGLIAIAIIALGEFSSLFTLPIFLQSVHGFTPLQSGYALLPLALAIMVAAPISANLVNRIGTKWVISTGIALETLGIFIVSRLNADTTYASLVPGLIILGIGIGLAVSQNVQVILSEIEPAQSGSASGVLNTVRQLGTALGIAIIGAVLAHQASIKIPDAIRTADLPSIRTEVKEQIAVKIGASSSAYSGSADTTTFIPAPPEQVKAAPNLLAQYNAQVQDTVNTIHKAINRGLADSISAAIAAGAMFMVVGTLLSLLIPNVAPHKREDEQPVEMA